MQKNTFKKEITVIEAQIDQSINRIAYLLQVIDRQKLQPVHKVIKQELNEELNQTYHQTDHSATNTQMSYQFVPLHTLDQEILLDNYHPSDNKYSQQIVLVSAKQMIVPTKSNWIHSFLDLQDTKVIVGHKGETLQLLSVQNGYFNCMQHNARMKIQSSQVYMNNNITVSFPLHLRGCQLNFQIQSQKILYQFTIGQESRILFECPNPNSQLIRFLIIKEEDEDYQIVWGLYSQQQIFQSLILQSGIYIILPLSDSAHYCNIYYSSVTIIFKKDTQHPFKTFNLMKKVFQQCRQSLGFKRSFSSMSDQDIQKQYVRSCYMNYGIVVQIYYNIFQQECRFVDESNQRQDKELLFKGIYSELQLNNILGGGQQLFKFYIITKKPANLFIPHKKVVVNNKAMENITYHHVFK